MNTKRAMVLFVIETTFWIASMLGIGLIMLGLMSKQVELLVGSLVFSIVCIGISVYLRRIVKKEMKEGQYQKIVITISDHYCYIPLFTEEDYDLSVSLTYWEMEKEAKKILGIK